MPAMNACTASGHCRPTRQPLDVTGWNISKPVSCQHLVGTGGQTGSYRFSETSNHSEDLSQGKAAARAGMGRGKWRVARDWKKVGAEEREERFLTFVRNDRRGGGTRKKRARRLFGGAGEDGTENGKQEDVGGGERAKLRFEDGAEAGDDDGEFAAGDQGHSGAEAGGPVHSGAASGPVTREDFRKCGDGGEQESDPQDRGQGCRINLKAEEEKEGGGAVPRPKKKRTRLSVSILRESGAVAVARGGVWGGVRHTDSPGAPFSEFFQPICDQSSCDLFRDLRASSPEFFPPMLNPRAIS